MFPATDTQLVSRALEHVSARLHTDPPRLEGQGLEFLVYRASAREHGDIAIKIPRQLVYDNDNDSSVSATALLRQEAACARLLSAHDLPAPEVLALELCEAEPAPFGYLVQRYIEHDNSPPAPAELGRLIAALHTLPAPGFPLVAAGVGDIEETLAERLCRRVGVVARLAGISQTAPSQAAVERVLRLASRPRRLLHMDARGPNILTGNGSIRALIDWSNAVVGDPYLELARIDAYGLGGPAFHQAYRRSAPCGPPGPLVQCIYRLDVAAMLGVVFLSEVPDPVRGREQVAHLCALLSEYRELVQTTDTSRGDP